MIRFHLFCFFFLINFLTFSQVELVKEFERLESFDKTSPENFVEFKDELYFIFDGGDGLSIWKIDSVSQEPIEYLNQNTDFQDANPRLLDASSKYLFFYVNTLESGFEIWRTDGTITGTEIVGEMNPSSLGSGLGMAYKVFNNELIFLWYQDEDKYNLWKTKGENLGFELLSDSLIYPINFNNFDEIDFIEFNNEVYFTCKNTQELTEVWKLNEELDTLIRIVNSDSLVLTFGENWILYENNLVVYNQYSNTFLKLNETSDTLIPFFTFSSVYDEKVYFLNDGTSLYIKKVDNGGQKFYYKTDLTTLGTNEIVELYNKNISQMEFFNNKVYIVENNSIIYELDIIDYSTTEVFESNSYFSLLTRLNGELYYSFPSSFDNDVYLIKYNLIENSFDTVLKVFLNGYESLLKPFDFNSITYVNGFDTSNNVLRKLESNSTFEPILEAKRLITPLYNYSFFTTPNYVYYAQRGAVKTKFFAIESKTNQTTFLGETSTIHFYTVLKELIFGDAIIFQVDNKLFHLDASVSLFDSLDYPSFSRVFKSENDLYFYNQLSNEEIEIGRISYPSFETSYFSIIEDSIDVNFHFWVSSNSGLFLLLNQQNQNRYNLYKVNSNSAILLKDKLNLGYHNSDYKIDFFNNCSCWLFSATNSLDTLGFELWRTDGTQSGTFMVKDINTTFSNVNIATNGNSHPFNFNEFNNSVYFFGNKSEETGFSLFKTDGTSSGTELIKTFGGYFSNFPFFIKELNGKLIFNMYDSIHGNELWQSDGTFSGTTIVGDVFVENNEGVYDLLNAIKRNKIYFSAKTYNNGAEIWTTDGTEEGTNIFYDLYPGEKGSLPYNLKETSDAIYFQARFAKDRWGIFKIDLTPPIQVDTPTIFPNPSSSSIQIVSPEEQSHIRIFDLTGKLVYDKVVSGTQNEVDISTYRAGLYIAQIESTGQFQSVRFIKL